MVHFDETLFGQVIYKFSDINSLMKRWICALKSYDCLTLKKHFKSAVYLATPKPDYLFIIAKKGSLILLDKILSEHSFVYCYKH